MSEPQLERSVLEAKEREELFAIANALGTRPTSRARKSELVNQILQATGVEVVAAEPAERPRRARAKRLAPEESGQLALGDAAPAAAGDSTLDEPRSPVPASSEPPPARRDGVDDAAGSGARGSSGASGREAERLAVTSVPAATSLPAARPLRRPPGSPGDGVAQMPDRADRRAPDTGRGAPGAGGSVPPAAASGPELAQGSPATRDGRPEAAPSQEEPNGSGRSDAEPANRRSRRRRGRDRVERDLAGQAPEQTYSGEPLPVEGLLDLREEGYGFLRTAGYLPSVEDVYVSVSQVRRFGLRRGDHLSGGARPAGGNEKYPALVRVDAVSGLGADEARGRRRFEDLTAVHPDSRLPLAAPAHPDDPALRLVEVVCPIGRGARVAVVSPPNTGQTTLLRQLARAAGSADPEAVVLVLLVDERPEEVTEMSREVGAEVVASTFDRPAEEHVQVAELLIERAKRLVELGRDVVVVADGLTRLARSYHQVLPASARALPGGGDAAAIALTKKFFGAGRNLEEGGSLTLVATVATEAGGAEGGWEATLRAELVAASTVEVRLDRRLAAEGVFPAVDLARSATRHEQRLVDVDLLARWRALRSAALAEAGGEASAAAVSSLLARLSGAEGSDVAGRLVTSVAD